MTRDDLDRFPAFDLRGDIRNIITETTSLIGEGLPGALQDSAFRRCFLRPALDIYLGARAAEVASGVKSQEYDVVIVGGGMLSVPLVDALYQANSALRVLVVEQGRGSRTFAECGDAFLLNTDAGCQPSRHPFAGVNLDSVGGERFMPASVFFDGLRAAWWALDTDVWCHACVESIIQNDTQWSLCVRYRGELYTVRTDAAVITTGFGKPRATALPETLRDIARRLPGECEVIPSVFTADSFLAHGVWGSLGDAPWLKPSARLAVVGAGPSAYGVLATLTGHGPTDFASRPSGSRLSTSEMQIEWYTGAAGPTSADDLVQQIPKRLKQTEMARILTERYASLWCGLARRESQGRLKVIPRRAQVSCDSEGLLSINGLGVDAVVDCTGYGEHALPGGLAPLQPTEVCLDGDVVQARGLYFVGDCIRQACQEDFSQGPFEQWEKAARHAGELVARRGGKGRGPARREHLRLSAGSTRKLPIPTLPVHLPQRERAGLCWLLSILGALMGGSEVSLNTENGLRIDLPSWLPEECLTPRTRSGLAQIS